MAHAFYQDIPDWKIIHSNDPGDATIMNKIVGLGGLLLVE